MLKIVKTLIKTTLISLILLEHIKILLTQTSTSIKS